MLKRIVGLLSLATVLAFASGDAEFPPLAAWGSAVAAANETALAKLYSVTPPPRLLAGQTPVPSTADEVRYWTGLKTAGITDLNPKLLQISRRANTVQLVLRLAAVHGTERLVGGMQQIWIPQSGGWVIAASQRSELVPDRGRALPEPTKPNAHLYPEPGEAEAEIAAALKTATAQHKRVLLVFGANWCYDCHVLDNTFRSPQFAPEVNANFVVVHINIGDEGKDNSDIAARYGVGLDKGVPSLAVLAPTGKVLTAQRSGEFENTTRIGPKEVRAFLDAWKQH